MNAATVALSVIGWSQRHHRHAVTKTLHVNVPVPAKVVHYFNTSNSASLPQAQEMAESNDTAPSMYIPAPWTAAPEIRAAPLCVARRAVAEWEKIRDVQNSSSDQDGRQPYKSAINDVILVRSWKSKPAPT